MSCNRERQRREWEGGEGKRIKRARLANNFSRQERIANKYYYYDYVESPVQGMHICTITG
jgi:hypothetical protein